MKAKERSKWESRNLVVLGSFTCRSRTLCGTPNYIAPEMLGKKGHSYEVDIWAIGCILYTLLVGKPPFETQSLKETYAKIRNNEYVIPSRVSANARHLIERLLQPEPQKRPTINELLQFDFFTQGKLVTAVYLLAQVHGSLF